MTTSALRKSVSNFELDGRIDVILVDVNDRSIGIVEKMEAHKRGLQHRAFSILICDRDQRLLLQRRSLQKYHSGGLWTNACCGHPLPNEETIYAARRRLMEEMGFACDLSFLFSTRYCSPVPGGLIENEVVHVFGGQFDGTPVPDPKEVMDWDWRSSWQIEKEILNEPHTYTVWFREYWSRYLRKLFLK